MERTHQGTAWHPCTGSGEPRGPEDLYASPPPWDIGRPQPARLSLARAVHRVSMGEIITAFADGWQIDSIEPATIDITTDPGGIRSWLAALTRI